MSRISQCESCGNKNWRETEIYDDLGAWEGQYPLLCWQCGIAAKMERDRIIKLLEPQVTLHQEQGLEASADYLTHLIALIKGENK